MKTNLSKRIISLFSLAVIGVTLLAPQPLYAADLKCSVLPASFCSTATADKPKQSAIYSVLEWVLGIMTAGVGIVAIAAFVYAGIMYASSDGKPEQVNKAKDIIVQAVIGLITFAVMALVIIWLIPGGIF